MPDHPADHQRSLSFSTDDVPPAQRIAAWEDMLAQVHLAFSITAPPDQSLQATLQARRLHDLSIVELHAGPHRGQAKGPGPSPGPEMEQCLLLIPLAGRLEISLTHRDLVLVAQDMALIDLEAGFEYRFPAQGAVLALLVPRHRLIDRVPQLAHAEAVPLLANHALQPLLTGYLLELSRTIDTATLRPPMSLRLVGHALDLLGTICADILAHRPAVSPYRASLLRRIKDFIELELHEPAFGVQAVAAKYRITTRYIAMLFQEDGTTFSDFLRQRRLEHCRRQLERPGEERQQIGAIALGAGFTSQAHFSRLFRATYQKTPRQYRSAFERHADPPPAGALAAKPERERV